MLRPTNKAQSLIDDFGDNAKTHGFQEDAGTGRGVDTSKQRYEESKAKLERFVAMLQEKIRRLNRASKTEWNRHGI